MTARIRTSISREMPLEVARARIEDFRDNFGEAHYQFAQHAAFPLALTPDLLYRMRESFQRTSDERRQLDIPWIAIADLLLSPLCVEADLGYELYEMDVSIRAQLLEELRANPDFGTTRLEELAYFLRNYVEEQLTGPDPMILDLAQSQTWTALAYIKPDQAAQELAEQIKIMYTNGSLEQVRITSIMEALKTLNTPLSAFEGFRPLLTYAQFQAHSILGHQQSADAPAQIQRASIEVAKSLGVSLPLNRKSVTTGYSAAGTQQEPGTIKDLYISHHIADHDWAEWIANQLQDAGYSVNWGFQFGPASSLDIDTRALHNQARNTIALLSPDYLNVDSVQKEWTVILAQSQQQEQRLLLPIRVRECTPQGTFASIQYLDLVRQDEATAREMLLQFIRQSLSRLLDPSVKQNTDAAESERRLTEPLKLFYSYTREDGAYRDELDKYLSPLKSLRQIVSWPDRKLPHSGLEEKIIEQELNNSNIILLLISADFLASDYHYDVEVKQALERQKAGEARVVLIILRPTDWRYTPLQELQVLPSGGEPISSWTNRDEAFINVVEGLRKVIEELNASEPSVIDDDEGRIRELERKGKIDGDVAAYVELGSLYERLRRIDDAIRVYEEARGLQPSDANVLFALSRLYNDTGLYERAIEILNQLITLQPDFADAYKQRGLAYRREADAEYEVTGEGEKRSIQYKQAVADFERAVELRPDFEEALGSLGGLYQRLEDYERAFEYYQRLYNVNPSSSYGLGNLGSLSWYLGRREEARTYFTRLKDASQARLKEKTARMQTKEDASQTQPEGEAGTYQTRLKGGLEEAYWDYYDLALSQLATGEIDAAKETYAKAIEETPAIAPFNAVLNNLYLLQKAQEPIKGLEEIIAMIENAKDVLEADNSSNG